MSVLKPDRLDLDLGFTLYDFIKSGPRSFAQ